MSGRPLTVLATPTSMVVDTQREGTRGERLAIGELSVHLTYSGASPINVPTGAGGILIQYVNSLGANPAGFVSFGGTVPQVLIFGSQMGVQRVSLDINFSPVNNEGSVEWQLSAEVGFGFDSGSPPPPTGSFAGAGFSNNSFPAGQAHFSMAAPSPQNLNARVRLTHDKGTDISTNITVAIAVASPMATLSEQRL